MTEPLLRALTGIRALLLDDTGLVRAVASGRSRAGTPRWRRAEVRYVDLKAGRRLQVVTFDATQSFTANYAPDDAREAVDALLDEPFGNWHVETGSEVHQLRVTKKGDAAVAVSRRTTQVASDRPHDRAHDREKARLLPEDHPVLVALGISDGQGRVKPTRRAKYRQVEEFLRLLESAVTGAIDGGKLRRPSEDEPLRIADLGCGNAYLTFTAQAFLAERGIPTRVTGVDSKQQALDYGAALAEALGAPVDFVRAGIGEAELDPAPEIVLALHACDTATDDALARAVTWEALLILAAPCCHHDVAAQLRRAPTPSPYGMLTRDGILRERLADTLTDAFRAAVLRQHGYRVDVVEFVGSEHTPRNTLIRALRTGAAPRDDATSDLAALTETWRIEPRLATLLPPGRVLDDGL